MAGVKISELPAAASAGGGDLVPIVKNGVTSRATIDQLLAVGSVTDFETVLDFGAIGNGVADDATAFLLAAATGRTIFVPVPSVHYLISDGNIPVSSNTEFIGLGMQAAKIKIGPTSLNPLFLTNTSTHVAFRNLWLVGNQDTQPSASSFSASISGGVGSTDLIIDGCLIEDWTSWGIVLDGITRAIVSNNTVRRVLLHSGIHCSVTTTSTDVQVLNNFVSNTAQGNIHATNGIVNWTVSGNHLDTTGWPTPPAAIADNITGYTPASSGSNTLIVTDNICLNSANNGVHVGGDSVIVSRNIIRNPANSAITVNRSPTATPDQSSYAVVSDNVMSFASNANPTSVGIALRDLNQFTISGNVITNPFTGIRLLTYLALTTTNGSVIGNTITNVGNWGIELNDEVDKIVMESNVIQGGDQDIKYNSVTTGTPDTLLVGPNNYSSGATTMLSRLVTTSSTNTLTVLAGLKAVGSSTDINVGLVPKGAGVAQATVNSSVASVVTGLTVHDTSVSNAWPVNVIGAGINFSSADAGAGSMAGVRLAFGQGMFSASGNNSDFVWSTAPTTAGTMVPVANLSFDGCLNLMSTVASPQALPKFNLIGNIDRASWASAIGILTNITATTITDTTSAAAATIPSRFANYVGVPTFASTNAITATLAANFYIAGIPVGSNTTLTTAYALYSNGETFVNGTLSATAIVATGAVTAPSLTTTGNISQSAGLAFSLGNAGGTADAITFTPTVAYTAYTTNAWYVGKATGTNTVTNPTVNISGLGNKTIVKRAATALAAGDIVNGMAIFLFYDGTNMQLLNPVVN